MSVDGRLRRCEVVKTAGHERIVLDARVDRAADVEVPQQEAFLPVVERLEVDEGHDVLEAVVRLVRVPLAVERPYGVLQPLIEQRLPSPSGRSGDCLRSCVANSDRSGASKCQTWTRYHS